MVPSTRSLLYGENGSPPPAPAGASIRTYQTGTRLYIENGVMRVGVDTAWGGAIVEVSLRGRNFVNAFDPGREVQAALYDGAPYPPCGDCAGGFGWNPVQGGDSHHHGSPVLAQKLEDNLIYIKSRPHHWVPENKGGTTERPVPSDLIIEQWISLMGPESFGAKVRYRITHTGSDEHVNSYQELPAVYVNWEFARFIYYGGTAPWTNGEVTATTLPNRGSAGPTLYVPEQWSAFVDDRNFGLTVYVPGQYPYVTGLNIPEAIKESASHYFLPRTYFSFGPNSVMDADAYLFVGDYLNARRAIYDLHKNVAVRDAFTPLGSVDSPAPNAQLGGAASVSGWAFDNVQVSSVDVYVDNLLAGHASYGLPRPDVSKKWPHCPTEIGYKFSLDTTHYPNGEHVIVVKAVDSSGNTAIFPRIAVHVENASAGRPK
jgi:Big-like domain-containing protein